MKCYGLTGGIASGKSVVAKMLAAAKIPVINADDLARRVVAPKSDGLKQIIDRFGNGYILADGSLNREELGNLIFSDASARRDLENITHPLIANELQNELARYEKEGYPYAVYEAPLIFEKRLDSMFSGTLLIAINPKTQLERLLKRDKLSREDAQKRINSQMPLAEKQKRATITIFNDASVKELRDKLKVAWEQLTGDIKNFEVPPDM